MKEGRVSIAISTAVDRFQARLGRIFFPPKKNRFVLETPIRAISWLLGAKEGEIDNYRSSIDVNGIIRAIEENVKRRMPKARYEKIAGFSKDKNWIDILESIYLLIRIRRPEVVVETGVGEIGMSTTFILQALKANGLGHLYSVDPDKFYSLYGFHVGTGIPEDLKIRHTLVVGRSQDKLEELMNRIGHVDFFLHDGDHRYKTKIFEYELAFMHLNAGGFILS
ncbi:MAG: class I SAM-dependent methyltransferase, partial [Candidatus Micrarchaeaceae archaeon]